MRMPSLLEMRGVAKRYVAGFGGCVGTVNVLRSIDLTLHAGDAVAVVGPPGAGKSTLLLTAAGLLVPDRGDLRWLGDADRAAAVRHAVYHFAGARHASPPIPPTARLHLFDDPDVLGSAGVARLARWIARRCRAGESVLIATRNRATALVLAPRVLALAGGALYEDVIVAAVPRVAESPRPLIATARRASVEGAGASHPLGAGD